MIGTTVGKYRILGRLGRGGMGIVYKALDETLDREVAIKVLNPDVTDAELLKRFRAEAVSLARLNHPGIATIYELHRHGDDLLMVMEFVRGATLQSLSERLGPLDPPQAAQLCVQILDALAHAHRAGIVHRDLKPANVMVTDSGAVKIMDFGIARVLGGEQFTHAGYMMGTPAYMAPEQVLGQEIDGRADLYSVGVLFYRLLSRELPFQADTAIAMAQKQVADAPTPLGTFRPNLPPWCEVIITRALAKAPSDRFQTAEAFRAAILSAVTPESIGELPTMATPVPAGLSGANDVTLPVASALAGATRTVAYAGRETGSSAAPVVSAGPRTPTSGTGAVPPAERTGTTVVLGRGHLITLAAMLAVLVTGIAALGYFAFTRGSIAAPEQAAPLVEQSPGSAAPAGVPADQPQLPEADTATATPQPAPADPGPAAMTPPATTQPAGGTPPSGTAGRSADAASRKTKPDPRVLKTSPAPPAAPAEAAAPVPDAAPITIDDVKVLVTQGDSLRDRDATLRLAGDHLSVLDRDGATEMLSLPYASIVGAFYSRSRQPKWKGPDGREIEVSVDQGRLGFFRGDRNWLIFTTQAEPVFIRVENAQLQATLAAVRERIGITVQR